MANERRRLELLTFLEERWGPEPADALMSMLPPYDWDHVATKSDLAELRGEFAELRGEFAELRGEFGGLRAEFTGFRTEIRAEIRGMYPRLLLGQIATGGGLVALVLGASRLL